MNVYILLTFDFLFKPEKWTYQFFPSTTDIYSRRYGYAQLVVGSNIITTRSVTARLLNTTLCLKNCRETRRNVAIYSYFTAFLFLVEFALLIFCNIHVYVDEINKIICRFVQTTKVSRDNEENYLYTFLYHLQLCERW